MLVGVAAAMVTCRFLGNIIIEIYATRVLRKFMTDLFYHLLQQNLAYFSQVSTSELIMRSSQDSRVLRSLLTSTALQFVQGIMLITGALVSMDLSSMSVRHLPRFAVAMGIIIVALLVFAAFYALWARTANLLVRRSMGRLMGFTLESYVNITSLKILQIEKKHCSDHSKFAGDYHARTLRFGAVTRLLELMTELAAEGMVVVLFWMVLHSYGPLVAAGYGVGDVITLILQVQLLNQGFRQLVISFDRFAASLGSVERVVQLAQSGMMPPPADRDPHAERADCVSDMSFGGSMACCLVPSRLPASQMVEITMPTGEVLDAKRLNGHLQLAQVDLLSHQFKGALALRGIDVAVRPGEMVVVRGPAASGKTALLMVAQLLARPNKGGVRFGFGASSDLVPVNELTHDYDEIRRQIGVVSSLSQQLFRTTLETNLCLGAHRPVSVQDMKDACVQVGIYDTIMALRSGFQTVVGDSSGVVFTKSEINQLMLVRALVRKPKLMMLDDADRHLSANARGRFLSLLAELREGGVGILIASTCAEVQRLSSCAVELSEDGRMLSGAAEQSQEGAAAPSAHATRPAETASTADLLVGDDTVQGSLRI